MRQSLLPLVIVLAGAQSLAQAPLPDSAWIADLEYLGAVVEADYPHLYDDNGREKVSREEVQTAIAELIDEVPSLDDHEITVGIARIVALFGWGHTSLWLGDHLPGFTRLPVNLYHFSDGVFVEGAAAEQREAVGAEVVAVAGVPVEEALARVKPAFPVENEQWFRAHGLGLLTLPAVLHAQGVTQRLQEKVTFTLRRGGDVFEHTFPAYAKTAAAAAAADGLQADYGLTRDTDASVSMRAPGERPLYQRNLDRRYELKALPDHDAVYVRFSEVQPAPDEDIDAFFGRVVDTFEARGAERLVLDLRLNGGGNNFNNPAILRHLVGSRALMRDGELYAIIGRRTFSACQNLVNDLDTYTDVIFVGEPTGENVNFYGDNRPVQLSNSGLEPRLSFAWWQDKPAWLNAEATLPHLSIALSSAQYATNEDPILQRALTFDSEGFIRDPMAYLTELFQAGQMDKLAEEAPRLAHSPEYAFFPFEETLGRAGRQLITAGMAQEGAGVLMMVGELFPDSPEAIDGIAAGLMALGDTAGAAERSREVIERAPDSEAAERARARLAGLNPENE